VGKEAAHGQIDEVSGVFEVTAVDTKGARQARSLNLPDFEDALQAVAAIRCSAEAIVTRNVKDFESSPVQAISPARFVASIQH